MSFSNVLTLVHVLLSLSAIVAGFVVMFGWLRHDRLERWTTLFLSTTIATSATGFLFPFVQFLPSHAFGIVSLSILPIACAARYKYKLVGHFRWLYILPSVVALYLNVFVLIVQLFLKVPALRVLAPTQSEPPFAVVQAVNLLFFIGLGVLVTRKSGGPLPEAAPVAADLKLRGG